MIARLPGNYLLDEPDDESERFGGQPQVVRFRLPTSRVIATWILLGINIAMFLLSVGLSLLWFGDFGPHPAVLFMLGWKSNLLIMSGEYWRLLTSMFLHGNLMHIAFNGYALFILGTENERIYGTLRFLVIYFLAGFSGSIASYGLSSAPSVGASGAIFGLIGSLGIFFYQSRGILGDIGRNQLQGIIVVAVINIVFGFTIGGGIIDNYAHLGGLAGGTLAGWLLVPRYGVERVGFTPRLVRRYAPWGWYGIAALVVLLIGLTWLITRHYQSLPFVPLS
ncbi:MAG: rhomboid family intramembrane serine protease [Chloroflexaceae bacterium]|nr:rhomboid family intramembrane serine protease [Chloroflexaceae bacterium]